MVQEVNVHTMLKGLSLRDLTKFVDKVTPIKESQRLAEAVSKLIPQVATAEVSQGDFVTLACINIIRLFYFINLFVNYGRHNGM